MPKSPPPRATFGCGSPVVQPKSPAAVTHAGIPSPVQAKALVAPARAGIAPPPVRFGGTLQPASAPIRRAGPPPPPTAFGSPPPSIQAKALGAPARTGFAPPPIRFGAILQPASAAHRLGPPRILAPRLAVQRATSEVKESVSTDPAWLTDFLLQCGSISGASALAAAARLVLSNYAMLAGYEYQAKCAIEMKASLSNIELQVVGQLTPYRYVDLVLTNGQWVECKGYAAGYDPDESGKATFLSQAVDYARSGKQVNYRFKNAPPNWAKSVLCCVNKWEGGQISCNGSAPQLQAVIGRQDDVPLIKLIKKLYHSATGRVAPDITPVKPKASNDNVVQAPSQQQPSSSSSSTVVDPYADEMFVATLSEIRLMPQTPSVRSIRAAMESLVAGLSPEELEKLDEPYWYYGRMKW